MERKPKYIDDDWPTIDFFCYVEGEQKDRTGLREQENKGNYRNDMNSDIC